MVSSSLLIESISPSLARDNASALDQGHIRVSLAGGRAARRGGLEAGAVVLAQLDLHRREVLFEVVAAARAGDRDHVVAPVKDPGERELARCHGTLHGELADPVDELQVAGEVRVAEARVVAPRVALVEVVRLPEPAGEEAAAEWRVGDEADPELADGRQDLGLDVTRPERELGLKG